MSNNNKKEREIKMRNNKPKQTLYVNSYAGIQFSKVFDTYQDAWNFRETWKTEVGNNLPMNPYNGYVYTCDIIPGASVEDSWIEDRLQDSVDVG